MKHEIEIEGLPEGWEPVAYREPNLGEQILDGSEITTATSAYIADPWLIVKKKQPRRIVLVETEEKYLGNQVLNIDGIHISIMTAREWREVKETAPSLNNADDKESLRLSVDECKQLLNYSVPLQIAGKIIEFIKDK